MNKENLKTVEISEFLEKIDPEHFNCVYSCNGMTILRSDEYDNRLKYTIKLQRENKKQKEVIDKIFNYLEDKYGYNLTKGTINDTDVTELYEILKEVSE